MGTLLESEQSFPESTYSISIEQKAKVREFLEEIISEMVGGPLDEVPVTQIHQENECESSVLLSVLVMISRVIIC